MSCETPENTTALQQPSGSPSLGWTVPQPLTSLGVNLCSNLGHSQHSRAQQGAQCSPPWLAWGVPQVGCMTQRGRLVPSTRGQSPPRCPCTKMQVGDPVSLKTGAPPLVLHSQKMSPFCSKGCASPPGPTNLKQGASSSGRVDILPIPEAEGLLWVACTFSDAPATLSCLHLCTGYGSCSVSLGPSLHAH